MHELSLGAHTEATAHTTVYNFLTNTSLVDSETNEIGAHELTAEIKKQFIRKTFVLRTIAIDLLTGFSVDEKVVGLFFAGNVEEVETLMQNVQKLRILYKHALRCNMQHVN